MDEHEHRDLQPSAVPVAPDSTHSRGLVPLVLILGVLLIAIVKPWDLGLTGHGAASPSPAAASQPAAVVSPGEPATTPVPTPTGDPYAGLWITCGSPSGWRAATVQQWAGRSAPIRSWIAIEPVEATGPLDPAIPFAPVATDVVTALGYCSPLTDAERPPEGARAAVWAVNEDVARPLAADPLEPTTPNALGGLWRPAPDVAAVIDGFVAWPPGRYVLEVRATAGTFDRWLGIEIEDLGNRLDGEPAGSPAASAAPSASEPAPVASAASGASGAPTPGSSRDRRKGPMTAGQPQRWGGSSEMV